jgi:hypothetical protein
MADFSTLLEDVTALAVYVVLPFGGGAWLLSKSWKFLLAGPAPRDRARG